MKNSFYTIIIIFILSSQFLYGQWTPLKLPAGSGGAVHSIVVKGNKIFAGKHEGIFVSEDNGLHWRKVNPDLPARYYYPFLQSIAATEDYIVVACSDKEVHISRDDGENWVSQGLSTNPRTTPYILAADGDWIICGEITGKYFNGQSTNGGQSWIEFDSIPRPILSVAIKDSVALVGTPSGLFRSINYGLSWNKVYNISIDWNDPLPIAFSDKKVYVGVSQYGGSGYIISSPDSGSTWSYTTNLPCQFMNAVISSPSEADSNFIFAATDSGVFRSPDEGQSWIKKKKGLESELIFSLAFKVQDTDGTLLLFAGTSSGIFISSNYGNSWTDIGGPEDWIFTSSETDIYALSSQPLFHGYTKYDYSIAQTGYKTGIIHSTNNGSGWDQVYLGYLDRNSQILSFVVNSNNVLFASGYWYNPPYPGRQNSIVFTSDNGGSEWQTVYIDSFSYAPILGAHASDVYMRTNEGLFRLFDNGNSYEKLYPVLSPLASLDTITNPPVSSFVIDGNTIYLAGGERMVIPDRPPTSFLYNLIAYSEDHGQNWTRVESPLDSITMIKNEQTDTLSILAEIYPDGNHIMVGMFAYNFYDSPWLTAYGGGFYHLLYDGSKWIVADTAFTNKSIAGFAAHGSTIFMATEVGVYSTNNYGASWKDISIGMGNIFVKDLFVTDSYLFASTANGVWKRPLSEITSIDERSDGKLLPLKYSLDQNYPNPFNPETFISYQIAKTNNVKLIIYDVLGREVIKLVDKKQEAGRYNVVFYASHLSSGIYIYKLKAGTFEKSRKMLLLR